MIQEVNVQIDKRAIVKHIESKLDESIQSQMWWISAEKIAYLTDISLRFAEDNILSDVRMKAIERRKSRKRLYPARQAFEVINEIINEW